MSKSRTHAKQGKITDDAVCKYLQTHPDFFVNHPELFDYITIPHATGGAVSLLQHQVNWLKEKNRELERKLLELLELARENENLSRRMHKLALNLMCTQDLDSLLKVIADQLRQEFQADYTVLRLIGSKDKATYFIPSDDPLLKQFINLFETRHAQCGRLPIRHLQMLFGEREAETIATAVVVPLLSEDLTLGLLALGSHNDMRFQPGMGTLFLDYLGEIISHALALKIAQK